MRVSRRPRSAVLSLGAAVACLAGPATAQVRVSAEGIFGDPCLSRTGPSELRVRVENATTRALRGLVTIDLTHPAPTQVRTLRSAALSVPPNASGEVRVLSAGPVPANELELLVFDASGRRVAASPLRVIDGAMEVIVDATPGHRYATAQRAQGPSLDPSLGGAVDPMMVQLELQALTGARGPNSPLRVCPVERDPQTGEAILPRSAAGWGNASLVLIDAATLTALPRAERVALADYVHSGGQLALTVERNDELRHPVIEALVGGGIERVPGPVIGESAVNFDETLSASNPRPATFAGTLTFRGGNTHDRALASLMPSWSPSALGATAEYGDGQVHLLAWNPARAPALDDPWSNGAVQRLAHRPVRARPLVRTEADTLPVPQRVRDWLSPSVPDRPGFVRAVGLCVLAALALGPLLHALARRRRGAEWLPVVVAPLLSLVVAFALFAQGNRHREGIGRARRIAVADAPAGFARATVRRWRSYWSPTRAAFDVPASVDGASLVVDPSAGRGYVRLLQRWDGGSLDGVVAAPWVPLVVREDGFENLPGQVSIVPAGEDFRVINRLSVALEDVVVLAPDRLVGWWFRRIAPGRGVQASSGRALPAEVVARFGAGSGGSLPTWGTPEADRLAQAAQRRVEGGDAAFARWFDRSPERRDEWGAMLDAASAPGREEAWRSTGEPWVIARVAHPPRPSDAGYTVERDRTWLRVHGWGGAP